MLPRGPHTPARAFGTDVPRPPPPSSTSPGVETAPVSTPAARRSSPPRPVTWGAGARTPVPARPAGRRPLSSRPAGGGVAGRGFEREAAALQGVGVPPHHPRLHVPGAPRGAGAAGCGAAGLVGAPPHPHPTPCREPGQAPSAAAARRKGPEVLWERRREEGGGGAARRKGPRRRRFIRAPGRAALALSAPLQGAAGDRWSPAAAAAAASALGEGRTRVRPTHTPPLRRRRAAAGPSLRAGQPAGGSAGSGRTLPGRTPGSDTPGRRDKMSGPGASVQGGRVRGLPPCGTGLALGAGTGYPGLGRRGCLSPSKAGRGGGDGGGGGRGETSQRATGRGASPSTGPGSRTSGTTAWSATRSPASSPWPTPAPTPTAPRPARPPAPLAPNRRRRGRGPGLGPAPAWLTGRRAGREKGWVGVGLSVFFARGRAAAPAGRASAARRMMRTAFPLGGERDLLRPARLRPRASGPATGACPRGVRRFVARARIQPA